MSRVLSQGTGVCVRPKSSQEQPSRRREYVGRPYRSTPALCLCRLLRLARRPRPSLASVLQVSCKSLASHWQGVSNSHPKSILRRSKNPPLERAKSTSRGSKIDARSPRGLPGAPKSAQEPPNSAQERPRSAPRALQEPPKSAQERPKSAQERPKSAQERPKSRSRASRHASDRPRGTISRLRISKKVAFEGDPSRDSVEKRVRNDFRSIFESCAHGRTFEKHVKTYCFYTFWGCHRFFEPIDVLERKATQKTSKSSPKSSQDREKSIFGALFERLWATKSVEMAWSSDVRASKSVPRASKSVPRACQERPRAPRERP